MARSYVPACTAKQTKDFHKKITCAAILVKSSLPRIFFSRSRYDVYFARGSIFKNF